MADISTEIAEIQEASYGSEVRQSIVDGLNKVNAETLPSVSASDAGKFLKVNNNGEWEVGSGGLIPPPTGTKTITQNGLYDVTNYANADVNVSSSFGPSDEGKVVSNGALVAQTAHARVTQNGMYDTTLNNEIEVDVSGGGGSEKEISVSVTGGYNGGAVISIEVDSTEIFHAIGSSPYNLSYTPSSGTYTLDDVTWSVSVPNLANNTSLLSIIISNGTSSKTLSIKHIGSNTSYGYNYTYSFVWGRDLQEGVGSVEGIYYPQAGYAGFSSFQISNPMVVPTSANAIFGTTDPLSSQGSENDYYYKITNPTEKAFTHSSVRGSTSTCTGIIFMPTIPLTLIGVQYYPDSEPVLTSIGFGDIIQSSLSMTWYDDVVVEEPSGYNFYWFSQKRQLEAGVRYVLANNSNTMYADSASSLNILQPIDILRGMFGSSKSFVQQSAEIPIIIPIFENANGHVVVIRQFQKQSGAWTVIG